MHVVVIVIEEIYDKLNNGHILDENKWDNFLVLREDNSTEDQSAGWQAIYQNWVSELNISQNFVFGLQKSITFHHYMNHTQLNCLVALSQNQIETLFRWEMEAHALIPLFADVQCPINLIYGEFNHCCLHQSIDSHFSHDSIDSDEFIHVILSEFVQSNGVSNKSIKEAIDNSRVYNDLSMLWTMNEDRREREEKAHIERIALTHYICAVCLWKRKNEYIIACTAHDFMKFKRIDSDERFHQFCWMNRLCFNDWHLLWYARCVIQTLQSSKNRLEFRAMTSIRFILACFFRRNIQLGRKE